MKQRDIWIKAETERSKKRIIRPSFGDYVTNNEQFVSHLEDVRTRIETYLKKSPNPKPPRPLNILLAAPPGSGKSFLIKQMINSIDSKAPLNFEEVYVASFDELSELHGIFQRIQSTNLEGKIPVVFFDEIDSEVNGYPIYKRFLAPMWDGAFFIGKEKFVLGKSVFFFAGSTLSIEGETEGIINETLETIDYNTYLNKWHEKFTEFIGLEENKTNKIKDFVDRMDLIIRIPPISDKMLGKKFDDEYTDRVCMVVKKNFPDIKFIGTLVLQYLSSEMKKTDSMRPGEKLIFGSCPNDQEFFDIFCLPAAVRRTIEYPPGLDTDRRELNYVEVKIQKRKTILS